jgi:hypothetical protein
MARPLRIVYEGAFCHIIARDFESFIGYLESAAERHEGKDGWDGSHIAK